jgi:anion-transporting  ArsA/GET3 family ATPase
MTRTIVVTGAGGVGKTTLSAAMGVALARTGRKTLVLTIDPAKRLADALGVSTLGDEPTPVATVDGMWAAMLDVSASWEAIIHRYADPDVGDRLLVNPYFRAIADRFPAAQAYAAGERTAEYIESRSYDVIVVDTPPSGGGIDFFRAPATTGDLVSGKLLKWLTGSHLPGRSLLYRFTAKPMLRIADTILGGPMLSDVADFLLDLRTMYDALSSRSRTIERYLRAATTVIATTADPTPLHETHRFFRELGDIRIDPAIILFNRALPSVWTSDAQRPLRGIDDPDLRVAVRTNLRAWASEARRQSDAVDELGALYDVPVSTIAWRSPPPTTVEDLAAMITESGVMDRIAGS